MKQNRDSEGATPAKAGGVTERRVKPAQRKQPAREAVSCTVWLGNSVELPIIIEYPDRSQWAVSLGGHNPPAKLCWDCDNIDEAWRLHDAIYKLVMKTDPNLAGYAISESRLRSLRDQMSHRESLWNEFGTLQAAQCVGRKDL